MIRFIFYLDDLSDSSSGQLLIRVESQIHVEALFTFKIFITILNCQHILYALMLFFFIELQLLNSQKNIPHSSSVYVSKISVISRLKKHSAKYSHITNLNDDWIVFDKDSCFFPDIHMLTRSHPGFIEVVLSPHQSVLTIESQVNTTATSHIMHVLKY